MAPHFGVHIPRVFKQLFRQLGKHYKVGVFTADFALRIQNGIVPFVACKASYPNDPEFFHAELF